MGFCVREEVKCRHDWPPWAAAVWWLGLRSGAGAKWIMGGVWLLDQEPYTTHDPLCPGTRPQSTPPDGRCPRWPVMPALDLLSDAEPQDGFTCCAYTFPSPYATMIDVRENADTGRQDHHTQVTVGRFVCFQTFLRFWFQGPRGGCLGFWASVRLGPS